MAAYVAGDRAAFRELFRRYAGLLLALLSNHLAVREDAADLVQQTFLQLHRARHDFDPARKLRPWLVTIAMNLRREQARRRARRPEMLARTDAPLERPSEASDADGLESALALRQAVARLPEEQREVIELHWFTGLPFEEVAKIIGISLPATRVRAHRGYVRLRKALAVIKGEFDA